MGVNLGLLRLCFARAHDLLQVEAREIRTGADDGLETDDFGGGKVFFSGQTSIGGVSRRGAAE